MGIWSVERTKLDLQLDLAVMMDAVCFCQSTYRLEGDRLEILAVWDEIEAIRAKGRMLSDHMSMLPNVSALLRKRVQIKKGTPTFEWFGAPYNAWHAGKVSELPENGAADDAEFEVTYDDGQRLNVSKQELESSLDIRGSPKWKAVHESLAAAFQYLEDRLTDAPNVDRPYRLGAVYAVCSAVRAFNPGFIRTQSEQGDVAEMMERLQDIPFIETETVYKMREELPALVAAVNSSSLNFSMESITDFSNNVLTFWRGLERCPSWKFEARRVFALTPNSAASERAFSTLKEMFDPSQLFALADYVEGSVMLSYNDRLLG